MQFLIAALVGVTLLAMSSNGYGKPNETWFLLNQYQSHYYQEDGRIIDFTRKSITTSVGEAYALFFFLVNNDRVQFQKVLSWTAHNLAKGDLSKHSISWLWGENRKGDWGVLDTNTASDADLWICYTLLEAGRLWNNPEYIHLSQAIAARIAKTEFQFIPGFGIFMLPGSRGFHPAPDLWRLNPSYAPPFILRRFQKEFKSDPWKDFPDLNIFLLKNTSHHGFVPDWTAYRVNQGFVQDSVSGNIGSFDAIRVYLWAGMMSSRDPQSPRILSLINGWAQKGHHQKLSASINIQTDQRKGDPSVGFKAALLPYWRKFKCKRVVKYQFIVRYEILHNPQKLSYYDWNLLLFGTGFIEGRFSFDRWGELQVPWKKEKKE